MLYIHKTVAGNIKKQLLSSFLTVLTGVFLKLTAAQFECTAAWSLNIDIDTSERKEKRKHCCRWMSNELANVNRSTTEANYFFLSYSPVLAVKLNAVSNKQFATAFLFLICLHCFFYCKCCTTRLRDMSCRKTKIMKSVDKAMSARVTCRRVVGVPGPRSWTPPLFDSRQDEVGTPHCRAVWWMWASAGLHFLSREPTK